MYKESDSVPFGGHKTLRLARPGAGGVVLVAAGYLVHTCLKTAARAAAALCVVGLHVTRIPKCGRTPDDLLHYVQLAAEDIVAAVTAT